MSGRNIWGCGLGRAGIVRDGHREREGCWDRDGTDLRLCRWDPGPGGCGSCEGGGAGGAPKKARNPPAGDIICPTLPCSSLGFTEGSGLPTSPDTRANWLGDIRPACRGGQRGHLESARQAKDLGWPARATESQVPEPWREKGGIKHRKELYLGSSEQLGSLQVCENGRDAVGERVAQEGGILGKELGKQTPITDHDWQMGQSPGRPGSMGWG